MRPTIHDLDASPEFEAAPPPLGSKYVDWGTEHGFARNS